MNSFTMNDTVCVTNTLGLDTETQTSALLPTIAVLCVAFVCLLMQQNSSSSLLRFWNGRFLKTISRGRGLWTVSADDEDEYPSLEELFEEGYHYTKGNAVLEHFDIIKSKSNCIFAKSSRLWGAPRYPPDQAMLESVRRTIPVIEEFVSRLDIIYLRKQRSLETDSTSSSKAAPSPSSTLDGIVIELESAEVGKDVGHLADGFREFIECLAQLDPAQSRFMDCKLHQNAVIYI